MAMRLLLPQCSLTAHSPDGSSACFAEHPGFIGLLGCYIETKINGGYYVITSLRVKHFLKGYFYAIIFAYFASHSCDGHFDAPNEGLAWRALVRLLTDAPGFACLVIMF